MRGKIVLSLALAFVILLGAMNATVAQGPTTLSVNPSVVTKLPGEMFQVTVDVTDVVDLFTFAFEFHYAPYANLLAYRRTLQGPFMPTPDFDARVDTLSGVVKIGSTRLGHDTGGVSGSGTLAILEFVVVDGGACELTLDHTELYNPTPPPEDASIPHMVVNGLFNGAHGVAVNPLLTGVRGDSHTAIIGDTITLSSSVTNVGAELPVTVKVRYDLARVDGRTLTFWAPQPKSYTLYADGFTGDFSGYGWDEYGTGPYLDAVGDGNYIETPWYCAIIGLFTFQDLPAFSPGEYVTDVSLYAYSTAQNPEIDGDCYIFNSITEWWWSGSIECGAAGDWYFTEYDLDSVLYDEDTINSAMLLIHYWTPDYSEGPTMTIDAVKLVVNTDTEIVIEPGETVEMPIVQYVLAPADKGKYRILTATVYSTYYGKWNAWVPQPLTVLGHVTTYDYLIVSGKK